MAVAFHHLHHSFLVKFFPFHAPCRLLTCAFDATMLRTLLNMQILKLSDESLVRPEVKQNHHGPHILRAPPLEARISHLPIIAAVQNGGRSALPRTYSIQSGVRGTLPCASSGHRLIIALSVL